MINKRNIFGINVDDYSLKESMLKVDNFLNNTVLNTIHIINFDSLMDATENKVMKKCIEGLDLSIIGDEDILSFIGIESESRHNEISDNVFINEFLEKVEKSGATVYLVGSTNEVIESFANVLDKKYPDIKCIGRQIYEKDSTDPASVVNEINSCMPDIIISLLKSPAQEEFILENKDMLSSKLWLGLGCLVFKTNQNNSFVKKVKRFFYKTIIKWRIYNI